MNIEGNTIFKKLSKYFVEDLSKSEADKLECELSANNESNNYFKQISQVWELQPFSDNTIADRITQKTLRKISKRQGYISMNNFLKYAAIFIGAIGFTAGVYISGREVSYNSIEYVSQVGDVKFFNLPDGSDVWLNSKSRITYQQYFWGGKRSLNLDGEAYFHVHADKKHPFKVNISNAIVQVTGTKFSVCAYNNDPFVKTYLEEGCVSFVNKLKNEEYKMSPNQLIILNNETSTVKITSPAQNKVEDWRNGNLNFQDESLKDIARKLERKFGIHIIIVGKQIQERRYTGEFHNENLDQVLAFFQIASELKIKNDGKIYIITNNNIN